MAGLSNDFTALALSAVAALTEARDTPADRESAAYAAESLATACERLLALARRYLVSAEYRAYADGVTGYPTPIIADPAFRRALANVAARLEECRGLAGLGADRISTSLAQWLSTNSPAGASTLAAQADTLARMMKKRAGRVAI